MINFLKGFILFLWQLPQNILGFLLELTNITTLNHCSNYDTIKYLGDKGISLGNFIIFDADIKPRERDIQHEQGHQKQSLYLGWLYLPIIIIPAFFGKWYDGLFHKKWTSVKREHWYYSQKWEKWADRLGGVQKVKEK